MCYKCAEEINNNKIYLNAFKKIYDKLYYNDFKDIKKLWSISDINELFIQNINPFITNLMVVLGYEIHIYNMRKYNFDNAQMNIHKKRVKECFESDLINRKYKNIRISQMLWATYFIRTQIIEVGRLQFQRILSNDNKNIIKIHIPKGEKLDILSVKKSINDSRKQIEKIFGINKFEYMCNSWLLSNQLYKIINKNTNISMFHELFDVRDGEECIKDILNFVYTLDKCEDYSLLPETTILQKEIKEELLKGDKFYLGLGILKINEVRIS